MTGAKKNGSGWLWAGAGCLAVAGTLFMVTVMAVFFQAVREATGDGYRPPDFLPAVHAGDGLVSFEEEAVLSDVAPQGGELRAFEGKLYAMLDNWLYVYDPADGGLRFDPVEEWYAYFAPYTGADGGEAMGCLMMGYDDREIAFYDALWDERWRYAPEPPAAGLSAYLEDAATGDLRGDGGLATVVSIGFYNDGDYDFASPLSRARSAARTTTANPLSPPSTPPAPSCGPSTPNPSTASSAPMSTAPPATRWS